MQSLLRSRYPSTCEPAEDPTIANIVDTARYPIHELDGTQAAATIAKARAAWETYGEVSLPGFIRADVLSVNRRDERGTKTSIRTSRKIQEYRDT